MGLWATFGGMVFGWDTGLIGGVLSMKAFQKSFGLINRGDSLAQLQGNIVSVLQAGCFFGAMSGLYLPDRYGRKPTMVLSGIIFLIGSLIQTTCAVGGQGTSAALAQLYVGRIIGGFGVGVSSAVIPTYIAECSPRTCRGRISGMYQLLNVTGIMLSFFVNYGLVENATDIESPHLWRVSFALQMLPGVIYLCGIVTQPESPRWYAERGQHDRGINSLARLHGCSPQDPVVLGIMSEIEEDLRGRSKLSLWEQMKEATENRQYTYRVSIGVIVMFFQQWTGTNSINYFSPKIFEGLGITGSSSGLLATGIYGVVKVVCTAIFLMVAIEQMGRKWCFIVGGAIQVFAMYFLGAFSAIRPTGSPIVPASYAAIFMVYFYVLGYSLGWSSVPWAVSAEAAPNHLRGLAMAGAAMSQWLFNFVIAKLTPIMLDKITYRTFLIFGTMTVIAIIWAALFLPETAGLTLETVGLVFEDNLLRRSVQDLSPRKRRAYRAQLFPKDAQAQRAREGDAESATQHVMGRLDGESVEEEEASPVKERGLEEGEEVSPIRERALGESEKDDKTEGLAPVTRDV